MLLVTSFQLLIMTYRVYAFLALFILWILYRLLVKKDLKQNLDSLALGGFFIFLWGAIYSIIA
jgi:hypothetical protein